MISGAPSHDKGVIAPQTSPAVSRTSVAGPRKESFRYRCSFVPALEEDLLRATFTCNLDGFKDGIMMVFAPDRKEKEIKIWQTEREFRG